MSYGLNVEMHKQTEICKRLDAIIRQVLPFLSGEVRTFFYTRCLDLVLDGNNMGISNLRASQTYTLCKKNTIVEFSDRKYVVGVF